MDMNTTTDAMDQVRALWEARKSEGWSMQRVGILMGNPEATARKSVSQFLKSKRPQADTLRRFMDAVGGSMQSPADPKPVPDLPASPAVPAPKPRLPFDPLTATQKNLHARRTVMGVLESYNGVYDAVAEAVQNSMDALEDAVLQGLPGPYQLEVTVDLQNNMLTILDTGIGMTQEQVCEAFAPSST